jgi:hypothetical protein
MAKYFWKTGQKAIKGDCLVFQDVLPALRRGWFVAMKKPVLKYSLIAGAAAGLVLLMGAAGIGTYVGSGRCRDCHEKEYKVWKESRHARSMSSLNEKEKIDPRCTGCHTTGEGRYGEVGCEACHGGGRHYAQPYVMPDGELALLLGLEMPAAKTCSRCHSRESSRMTPFDTSSSMKEIRHWKDKDGAATR